MFFVGSNDLTSLIWAGYVVSYDFTNPQPMIIGLNGSWIVPRVSVSQRDTFSAVWIGVGGQAQKDNTLIQTGTEQDSVNGSEIYSAWYELLPSDAVTISTIDVSAGDKIMASINLVDSTTDLWSIEIRDVTTNQMFKENFFYDSSRFSAEWIAERPAVNDAFTTLANFGNLTFTNAKAAMDNAVGTISNFPFARVIMENQQNRKLATVSSLSSGGSSFTVTYLSSADTLQSMLNKDLENELSVTTRKFVFVRVYVDSIRTQRRLLAFS
jgi:hypothetical protein